MRSVFIKAFCIALVLGIAVAFAGMSYSRPVTVTTSDFIEVGTTEKGIPLGYYTEPFETEDTGIDARRVQCGHLEHCMATIQHPSKLNYWGLIADIAILTAVFTFPIVLLLERKRKQAKR